MPIPLCDRVLCLCAAQTQPRGINAQDMAWGSGAWSMAFTKASILTQRTGATDGPETVVGRVDLKLHFKLYSLFSSPFNPQMNKMSLC